jgi:hypothetical protein
MSRRDSVTGVLELLFCPSNRKRRPSSRTAGFSARVALLKIFDICSKIRPSSTAPNLHCTYAPAKHVVGRQDASPTTSEEDLISPVFAAIN